jgi:parallel beta-helix repeat protein
MRTHAKPIWISKLPALGLRLARALGALAVLLWPTLAYAIDKIACGDTLGPGGSEALDDNLHCVEMSPALKIVGPFTLDLNGFTVSCGDPDGGLAGGRMLTGTGIEVVGVRAKVRNGTIAYCGKGVVVEGDGRHELKRLTVTSPEVTDDDQGIAFRVKSDRNWFIENTVEDYAGEGFRLEAANRNLLMRNKAIHNANHGFRVKSGERNLLLFNRAKQNAAEGFRSEGSLNRFAKNTAIGNGDEGFRLKGAQDNQIIGNIAIRNGLVPCDDLRLEEPDANPGIAITDNAKNNAIINNITKNNCIGIAIQGGSLDEEGSLVEGSLDNEIIGNVALHNKQVDLADGNDDCDDNKWFGNRFKTSLAAPDFSVSPPPECIR